MNITPYETTLGKLNVLTRVEQALHAADIKNELILLDKSGKNDIYAVTADVPTEIPPFIHPITLEDQRRGRKVVVDLRPYSRMVRKADDGGLIIDPFGGAALMVNRAILQYHWDNDLAPEYLTFNDLPVQVYSRWLSSQLTRALSVDPVNEQRLTVVFALFYYTQFSPAGTVTATDITRGINKLSRVLKLSADVILNNIPETIPTTLPALIELLSSGEYGVRLEELNLGLFITAATGGFYGMTNPKEVIAVAIEYPPTFLAILFSSINDRSFNKTPLTIVSKPFDRAGAFKDFGMAFSGLIGTLTKN